MDLDEFIKLGRRCEGAFRPFGQGGYMVTHTENKMPGGLCRALSCAYVTYNHGKDDNLPFWLNPDLYASQKFFSALGASKEVYRLQFLGHRVEPYAALATG
jgi:hypothetical protein